MRIFDCHAHLACDQLAPDLSNVLERMRSANVLGCMVVCDPGDLEPDHRQALALVSQTPGLYLSAACHPQNALHYSPAVESVIIELAEQPCCRCIGEIGLDRYENASTMDQQLYALERQMDIAYEVGLPVQLHVRNAHNEMTALLRKRKKSGSLPRGFVHCFTRSPELAMEYTRLGYSISFGGPVTFSNANRLRKTVESVPNEFLLIETDSPWVSPESRRGKPCEPSFITETLDCIAAIRHTNIEQLSEILWKNAFSMFSI